MGRESIMRTDCCKDLQPLPENIACFFPVVCKRLNYIRKRHECLSAKWPRFARLAVPVRINKPFVRRCPCKTTRHITIERTDVAQHTRTNHLALPLVRRLLIFKDRVKNLFPPERVAAIMRLTRLSLLSMYSRLSNIQPLVPIPPKHKWTKEEWKQHRKHFRKLAKPKKLPPVVKIKRAAMPAENMTRFQTLATPKIFVEEEKIQWKLTPGLKYYKPSENILKMAQPKSFPDDGFHTLPWAVSDSAKKYKPSQRVLELATPVGRVVNADLKENPFAIAPNALKAKASQRIEELAEPKEYENIHIRENPNYISPAALKAKATPRLIELAKPRGT